MVLSSRGIRFAGVDFDDLQFEHRKYEPFLAYGQSKTANALFAVEVDRRGQAEGIRAFAVHPGLIVDTGLVKHLDPAALQAAGALDAEGRPIRDPERQMKTVQQGAATSVWCATSPRNSTVSAGSTARTSTSARCSPRGRGRLGRRGHHPGVLSRAVDPESAARLWEVSERLTA